MKHEHQIVINRWIPILKEYERTKLKETPRLFKTCKALCEAHHISIKELRVIIEDGLKEKETLYPSYPKREALNLVQDAPPRI